MSLLAKTLEEMKNLKSFAEEDTDEGPSTTMGARRGRKNQAIQQLKSLREQYSADLLRGAAFILTVGSEREAFEQTLREDGSCFESKADSFFEDLSGRVHPSLYLDRDTVANTFDVVGRHLEDKAREIGMLEYPQLVFKSQYARTLKSPSDLSSLLKLAITEQVGGEVVGINAVRDITDSAIEKGHMLSVTPIVLSTEDQKYSLELTQHLERLTSRVFLVVAGKVPKGFKVPKDALVVKEVSKDSVEAALEKMRSSLKK